ncbi:MAG: hypothetical protein H0T41_03660, partial [Rhodobacteraceae bacterium]|nr:hypothetical protein [Paracoccaceae bacterium]
MEFYPGAHLSDLFDLEARNPDGSDNNLANPTWGVAHGQFNRVTENSYPDGLGTLWDLPVENSGSQGIPPNILTGQVGVLPQPREIRTGSWRRPRRRP